MPRKPTTVYSVWPAAPRDDVPTAIDRALMATGYGLHRVA